MKTLSNYKEKIPLGKVDGKTIYLSPPSWDCDWYWGFGYLGNEYCHYHVDGLTKREWYDYDKKCFQSENLNMFHGFKKHFDCGTFIITADADIWTFCELFESFYILRETAEVLGPWRGSLYY